MNLTFYSTKNYDNKSGLLTPEKQTQTNPIKPNLVRLRRIQKTCLLFRFVAVFGAQGSNERIKEERKNRQPAYGHKYPAVKTHRISFPPFVSALFSARSAKPKMPKLQKALLALKINGFVCQYHEGIPKIQPGYTPLYQANSKLNSPSLVTNLVGMLNSCISTGRCQSLVKTPAQAAYDD
jgi:hypothetical protein